MQFLLDIMLTMWSRFAYVVKSACYIYDCTMSTQQIIFIKFELQKFLYSHILLPSRHYTTDIAQAKDIASKKYAKLGELVAVDGSLVDATLSMYWAEYWKGSNKFKAHVGFNVNQGLPQKLHLTEEKGDEHPFDSYLGQREGIKTTPTSTSGGRTIVTSFAGSRKIQLKSSFF